ncbi:polysaccharide deacetylase family protein [uncultured Tateyamaria sp.]|uniref:polysaccharide deacetylase family protein n=1 Tax=uncultured Tateyamaria sp. TaxID=455651 RepID=UPI00260B6245|nr:polysaccharide deacetylase family protein [uncultured Tateyamaria sp.]
MRFDWSPLRTALKACRRDALNIPIWWRDDDAIAHTAALDQLGTLSNRLELPVHLAVIPAHANPSVVGAVADFGMVPVVHGWAHVDHSAPGEKKNEFMTMRAGATEDTGTALNVMTHLFGNRLRPMFVPPWNRINDQVTTGLARQGYSALSTFGARTQDRDTPGLVHINTHIDPIWWKGTRDLLDPDQLIAQTVTHLDARRTGTEDAGEPLGLLTHHLVHTPAIWSFTEQFLHEMRTGGATPWAMATPRTETET